MTTTTPPDVEALLSGRPLRERKRARLRLTLLDALTERVETTPFAEISVRELASAAEVSEPTFFAQFPSKTDLLVYHVAIWRIRTTLTASAQEPGHAFLRAFFDETAEAIQARPRMWFEITAEIARHGGLQSDIDLSPSERLIACRDARALELDTPTQAQLMERHVRQAVPARKRDTAVIELLAGFYGMPLALGPARLDQLPEGYRRMVDRCCPGRTR